MAVKPTQQIIKVEPTTVADEAARKRAEAEAAAPAKAELVAEKGDVFVAVHAITQTGADGNPEQVVPGTVFTPALVDLPFLKQHEAVREPTEQELALYKQFERSRAAAEDALG